MILEVILNAILLAGYYAVLATGLAFMYSVMNIINLAHGSLIILAAYGLWLLGDTYHISLLYGIPIIIVGMFILGLLLHRIVLYRASQSGELISILATFGIAIILDNIMFGILP